MPIPGLGLSIPSDSRKMRKVKKRLKEELLTEQKGRGFISEVEGESCMGRKVIGEVVLHSGEIRAGGPRRCSFGVLGTPRKSKDTAGRTTPGVRKAKGVRFREKKMHLIYTHLEQVQHCTELPLQVILPAIRKKGEDRTRIWINFSAYQSRRITRRGIKRQENKWIKDRRLILMCTLPFCNGLEKSANKYLVRGKPRVSGPPGIPTATLTQPNG